MSFSAIVFPRMLLCPGAQTSETECVERRQLVKKLMLRTAVLPTHVTGATTKALLKKCFPADESLKYHETCHMKT